MKIKVILNNGTEKVLRFDEYARKSVMAKYSQLVSEGEIESFELV
jgi:hypothetical protein